MTTSLSWPAVPSITYFVFSPCSFFFILYSEKLENFLRILIANLSVQLFVNSRMRLTYLLFSSFSSYFFLFYFEQRSVRSSRSKSYFLVKSINQDKRWQQANRTVGKGWELMGQGGGGGQEVFCSPDWRHQNQRSGVRTSPQGEKIFFIIQ